MARLDHCTTKMMDVVSSRTGATGVTIRHIKDMLLQPNTTEVHGGRKRTVFKEFRDTEAFEAGLKRQLMKTTAIAPESDHMTAIIMVEGTKILERKAITRCCALLTGI